VLRPGNGILPYKDARNDERLNESLQRDQLERKLIYCLGNWIQWQSHSDPTMDFHGENKLGMLRVDGPSVRDRCGAASGVAGVGHGRPAEGRREERERLA